MAYSPLYRIAGERSIVFTLARGPADLPLKRLMCPRQKGIEHQKCLRFM